MSLPIPTEAWKVVSMYRITHLPKTDGENSSLCGGRQADKGVSSCNAEATALLLENNCIRLHGWPSKVISDRGPEFRNTFVAALMKTLGTEHCKPPHIICRAMVRLSAYPRFWRTCSAISTTLGNTTRTPCCLYLSPQPTSPFKGAFNIHPSS